MHGGMDWVAWFRENIAGDLHRYARERWRYNQPIWELIQRRFPEGARIIECGSGAGTYGIMLAHFGYRVTGVELDPRMIELAAENSTRLGSPPIEFCEGSILDLSPYYGQYDLAYSCGVLEHFYHSDAVEILRQEGRCAPYVFVLVPSRYVWERQAANTEGIFERYTMRRLRRVVSESGLEPIEEIAFSAGNRLGRAVELLVPPILARHVFPHFAATIGVLARSPAFRPHD